MSKTQNVGARDWISPYAKDVADNSANSCCCAAKRLNRGWVIVGFNFCCYAKTLVKLDYSSVIFKHAHTPGCPDLFGCFGNVGFEETVDFFAVDLDFSFEGFVAAML